MIIEVHLFGSLKNMVEYSQDFHKVELEENATIGNLIQQLANFMNPEIKKILMDSKLDGRVSNFLILLNDREMSIYNGLQTRLRDEDIVTIIPVSHGG
jgi:molybdopterin converting factor small subunit